MIPLKTAPSIRPSNSSIHIPVVPLWNAVRRINQLFHTYDYDVDGWIHSRYYSHINALLLYRTAMGIGFALATFWMEPWSEIQVISFISAAIKPLVCLAVVFGTITLGVYWMLSLLGSMFPQEFNRNATIGSNWYWLALVLLHWLPLSSITYALSLLVFAIHTEHPRGIWYGACISVILALDLFLARRHRYHATDLLPLLLLFSIVPYSVICSVVIFGYGPVMDQRRDLQGMLLYWTVVLACNVVAFLSCYLIGILRKQ